MKNTFKVTLLSLLLCVGAVSLSAQQKIGHINMQQLVSAMPESAVAQQSLEAEAKKFDQQLKDMQTDFTTKVEEYQKGAETMTDIVRADKEAELQNIQQRIQAFNTQAQKQMSELQSQKLQPIFEKANAALAAVSKAQGITYVFDSQVLLYTADGAVDLFPLVKTQLGI